VLQGGTNEFAQCCVTTGAGHTLTNPWLGVKTNHKHLSSQLNAQRHAFGQTHMCGLNIAIKNCLTNIA